MKKKIRISIAGARGYTGQELVSILLRHPAAEIAHLYASEEGAFPFDEEFPAFQGKLSLPIEKWDPEKWNRDEDVLFLALPHGLAMYAAARLLESGVKVIDLSADFRLKDPKVFEKWYHTQHVDLPALEKAVYGLPELHQAEIKEAGFVANPGCYPTSVILPCAPLMTCKEIDGDTLIADSKSGVTGAGRKPSILTHFSEVNENFKAYGVTTHRHTPEIEQELSGVAGRSITVNFTPHLLPVNRGILSTIYVETTKKIPENEWIARIKRFYEKAPFVRVREDGNLPELRHVQGTNYCDIGLKADPRTSRLILVSVIDNLVKGASGQAVHNMNLMFGLKETEGLL